MDDPCIVIKISDHVTIRIKCENDEEAKLLGAQLDDAMTEQKDLIVETQLHAIKRPC